MKQHRDDENYIQILILPHDMHAPSYIYTSADTAECVHIMYGCRILIWF